MSLTVPPPRSSLRAEVAPHSPWHHPTGHRVGISQELQNDGCCSFTLVHMSFNPSILEPRTQLTQGLQGSHPCSNILLPLLSQSMSFLVSRILLKACPQSFLPEETGAREEKLTCNVLGTARSSPNNPQTNIPMSFPFYS